MFKIQNANQRDRHDTVIMKMSKKTQENNDTEMDVINDKSRFSMASNLIGFDDL